MCKPILTVAMLSCLCVFAASSASAQIIYEPVRYQYGGQSPYYYGGSDPAMFEYANALTHENGWGRTNGYAFHSGNSNSFSEVVSEPPRVYSDQLPYSNAAVLGYTAVDARNAAYNNVPRYFVKRDLIAAGVPEVDETGHVMIIVPAQARPQVHIYVGRLPVPAEAAPSSGRAPILIIPTPRIPPADKVVASAAAH